MVPNISSLSRRQLLVGLAGSAELGVLVVGATGATLPTALPDRITDWATTTYPTPPPASSLWQPTVTEAHARTAVALLAETEDESRDRWAELDRERAHGPGSGGWRSNAEEALENGDYAGALFDASYGMQFAGQALGEARAELGDADLDDLADRAVALFDRIDAVVADIESYPVADPERDLAWYVHIERELRRGHRLADWDALETVHDDAAKAGAKTDTGSDGADESAEEASQSDTTEREDGTTDSEAEPDRTDTDPETIGTITSGLLRGEIAVKSAERYRDLLWETVDGADGYADHLQRIADELQTDLESIPTRDEVLSSMDDDTGSYGPYEFAHYRLARWGDWDGPSPWETVDDDFLLLQVLEATRALADWRAYDDAVDELEIDADDGGFDSGHVLDEQRRARSTYRTVVGGTQTPVMVVLAKPAIGDIRTADVDRDSWQDGSWEPWNERVQSDLSALVGRARLREYPALYDRLVDGR
ncbi:hypothetical protein [Natrialba taiwanensis]|uniref:Uncharacterized protein n=1 Tax=Natrialba taiwanensis DSM 12281 TaxID=1230458 RepID=M0ABS7_9EURY|nr:hypothetical protein [Natrialba taiwanensis]ELY95846.1 hypothetical protein C484_02594 [Natrialba taiwanensis DSM 12281]